MPNQPINLPSVIEDDGRIDHLVVVRESPQYDYVLMEGMIGQTVGRLLHLPGADEVLAAGIGPVRGSGPFLTFEYRKHGTTAVMFEHAGVLYLYSLGSAAKANINDQENAFVELLIDVLEHYRPRNVYVATFSRLVRSTEFAGRLQRAMNAHVDVIHSGNQQIRPKTTDGKIMWSMLALIADMERDLIVQRLFAGTCNAYQRGRWVLNDEAVPPGYVLDPVTKKVSPDESLVEPVRLLLTMMADPTITSRRVVDAAGEAGLTSETVKRLYGPDATFADIVRADSKADTCGCKRASRTTPGSNRAARCSSVMNSPNAIRPCGSSSNCLVRSLDVPSWKYTRQLATCTLRTLPARLLALTVVAGSTVILLTALIAPPPAATAG
jgi:DNA invertase Pin-like site-specific DNA recombinase